MNETVELINECTQLLAEKDGLTTKLCGSEEFTTSDERRMQSIEYGLIKDMRILLPTLTALHADNERKDEAIQAAYAILRNYREGVVPYDEDTYNVIMKLSAALAPSTGQVGAVEELAALKVKLNDMQLSLYAVQDYAFANTVAGRRAMDTVMHARTGILAILNTEAAKAAQEAT